MIARNGLIQPFRELTRLNHVGSAAGADLVGKKLLEGFQRQILFLHLINLRQAGYLLQTASAEITSGEGALRVSVGGDMQLARIATTNATRDTLTLEVVGALDVAAGQEPLQIVANSIGALSELRIGQMLPEGPTGLQVALAALDLEAGLGDIHLNEADAIILQSVVARNGLIDIFSADRTEIHAIRSVSAAPIVLTTSTGDMLADNAVISGGKATLRRCLCDKVRAVRWRHTIHASGRCDRRDWR